MTTETPEQAQAAMAPIAEPRVTGRIAISIELGEPHAEEAGIGERFHRDTADHEMTILHDEGLYRHLRFRRMVTQKDGSRKPTSMYWFDLITWPGSLAINGDCGSFMFSRLSDMFEFFRGGRINPGYWAEKVQAGKTHAYSPELFRQLVAEHAAEAADEWPGLAEAAERDIFGEFSDWNTEYEEGARAALDEFRYQPVGEKDSFAFTDAWEWDLRDFDWQFLWGCHAVQWGISQYDNRAAAVAA